MFNNTTIFKHFQSRDHKMTWIKHKVYSNLSCCRSNFTLAFKVFYKIEGKFVRQTCNTFIFNLFKNCKTILNARSRPCAERNAKVFIIIPSNLHINIATLHRNIRFGFNFPIMQLVLYHVRPCLLV